VGSLLLVVNLDLHTEYRSTTPRSLVYFLSLRKRSGLRDEGALCVFICPPYLQLLSYFADSQRPTNEEFHNLYVSPNIIRVIKLRKMR
jgi:hypothetical protein